MKKTILIIAYEFAPLNRPGSTIGAQRPYQFAKQLSKLGNKVIVVTSNWKERRTLVPKDLSRIGENVSKHLNNQLDSDWITISVPSLQHADFWDMWWWKTVITNDKIGTFSPRGGVAIMIIRKLLTLIKIFRGDHSQSWQRPALLAIDEVIKKHKIDIAVAEHGPDASLYVGKNIQTKYGIPWIVDFRDPAERGFDPFLRPLYIHQIKKLVTTAGAIINVIPQWCQLDKQRYKKPTYCIPNGFDPDDFDFSNLTNNNAKFTIVYPGSIQKSQNIELFLDGLNHFVKEMNNDLNIRFQYFGASYKRVKAYVHKLGIEQYVSIQPVIERSQALEAMAQADLLLLLSIDTTMTQDILLGKGVYPGKVFEYFGLKKPIMNVPGDSGVLDELIESTNTGVTLSTKVQISKYLHGFYSKFLDGAISFHPDLKEIQRYNRQSQSRELEQILLGVLMNNTRRLH